MSRSLLVSALVLVATGTSAFAQLDPSALRYNPANFHTYALTPAGMNWQTAQAYSRTLGGHLVAINDPGEQAFIQAQYGGSQPPPYWIGLSDHETEGLWKWDSGEPVLYANFCANEPNNFGGVEDFVEIFPAFAGGAPCWNDDQSPYTGTGTAPTQAIIEIPHGDRVNFDNPPPVGFECVCPFPAPLGAGGNPEGISWNGASLGLNKNPILCSAPEAGMPVSGTHYLRMEAYGVRNVPPGGPLARPVPPGINEVRVAIPPGTKGVSLAWEFKHNVGTASNDGMDISVVDGAGALIANVTYADSSSPLVGSGVSPNVCGFVGGTQIAPAGPGFAARALPPLPHPAYLSIVCWKGSSTSLSSSRVSVDAIQFWGSGQFQLDITAPAGPGSIRLENTGGVPGNTYLTVVTLDQGSFPFGWLFGLDIPPALLIQEVMTGVPFSGILDGAGSSTFTLTSGVPPGLPVYAVSLQFASAALGGEFLGASAPEHFVTF
jgi:Lectin C-type domain